MEDIYDDLDNYDDVNALQELRSENQALKQKLEECTAAMGKLQNDYDDLALEFKKLEMNYSSLLKTARAEIERKTQIITNLNVEKDMMVLKSMQNGNNFRRSFYRSKPNMNSFNNVGKKQDNDKKIEESQKNNADSLSEGKDRSCLQANKPVIIPPSENTNRISNLSLVNTTEMKSDCKENDKHKQNPIPKVAASSIRNRRKSMPAVCVQEIFSSDDEFERQRPVKDIIQSVVPTNIKPERKQSDKVPSHRISSNKTSESSSIDDRYSNYQEHLRRSQRNRHHRYYDDKNRCRDKYEISQRSRRQNSPDRTHRRLPREYHDDKHYKSEHGRYRVLVSPPPDSYHHNNHTSNYHQRRNREHRPSYDRHPNEYDRHRHRYEKQSYKHKMSNDHDEPASKRQRIELFSNNSNCYPDEEERYTEIELVDRVPGLGHTLGIHDTSCQSPDYIHTETMSAYPVKEIMYTSAVPLEDPRKCSNKYVLKTDAEGTTTISTVTGRNIDIIPIDKFAWNIERVDVPRALTNHPTQFNEELIQEIYMDIDNPVANTSTESGEICFYSEKDNKKEMGNKKETHFNKPIEEYSNPHQPTRMVENSQTSSSTKYRIPKIKHDNNTLEEKRRSVRNTRLDSDEILCKSTDEDKSKQEYNSDNRIRDSMFESTLKRKYSNETGNSVKLIEDKNRYQSLTTLCARVNVEGDLELSDENSDVEISTQPTIEKSVFQATENRPIEFGAMSNINENYSRKPPDYLNNQEINTSAEKAKQTDCKKQKSKKDKPTEVGMAPSNVNENNRREPPDNNVDNINNQDINASIELVEHTNGKQRKGKKNKHTEVEVTPSNINENSSRKPPDNNADNINSQEIHASTEIAEQSNGKQHKDKNNKYTEVEVTPINVNENDSHKPPHNNAENLNRQEINASTEMAEQNNGKKHKSQKNRHTEVEVNPSNINENDSRKPPNNNANNSNNLDINLSTEMIEQTNGKKHKSKRNRHTEVGEAPSNVNENDSRKPPDNNVDNFNLCLETNASTVTTKETMGKKYKSKKKPKSKDTKQAVDNAEIVHLPDKKTKSKKDKVKPKVIDSKFSDLFGDSGSLIMPEDLGLPTYVPGFEDTQDAVDLNIKPVTERVSHNVNEVSNGIIERQNKNEGNPEPSSKYHEIKINIISGKVINVDTDNNEIMNKDSLKINNEKVSPERAQNIVYENVNPDNTVDNSNIVKTVIISSGVQPQFDIERKDEPVLEKPVASMESTPIDISEVSESLAINEFKKQECIKALATSTPHKEFRIPMETENRVVESSCSRVGSIDSIPSAVDQSENNTLDSNTDVPDVRIFVRRRRKIMKKPPAM